MRIHIITYGCQMNVYDSRMVASLFKGEGVEETDNPEDADIIIVNTCSVREHAERRALGRISSLQKLRREKPELVLVVIGCMAERLGDNIPGADFFIGPRKYDRLPETIREIVSSKQYAVSSPSGIVTLLNSSASTGQVTFHPIRYRYRVNGINRQYAVGSMRVGATSRLRKPPHPYPEPDRGVTAFLPVMRGCDNFCSYCIVPYVRGKAVSRNPEDILDELRYLKERGVREVALLGQSVNEYRYGETPFRQLLRMVDKESSGVRIRFLTSHPAYMNDELIEAIAECNSVCESVHLPLQSGSDRILQLMERRYSVDEYRHWIRRLRDRIENIAITTDIIVGFPTETEEDFKKTLDIVRKTRFDFAYMFMYSRREGTKAAGFSDGVSLEVKKGRLERLIALQNGITREKNGELVGKEVEILIEGKSRREGLPMGKTRTGKEVIIKMQSEKCKVRNVKMGECVNVYVESISGWTLIGKTLE
ncbi:hypothetical protein CH333_03500 [candidate division WOR-3 bacterium JGI_Cruoil_03_44_89]|uniref:tRNA-2-methylthio-N(6)-dimethylallyladenosine synthase n=1 Tax=candidate division WOR-3 bacterium JGI_Cruoil_03_44_89 TaxID=1973748 RepID=A0A235BX68_UNCW3|nr:MAG: hypothetical protein CH333_03500 [candidate division WOR-3 bacterium JGI_Cruoil_03_44_89]